MSNLNSIFLVLIYSYFSYIFIFLLEFSSITTNKKEDITTAPSMMNMVLDIL